MCLKQTDVARILGLRNTSMISRWEKGDSLPDFFNLTDLSLIYGISTDAFYPDYRRERKESIMKRAEPVLANIKQNTYAARERLFKILPPIPDERVRQYSELERWGLVLDQ